MNKIDRFLDGVERFGAEGVILETGSRVAFQFPNGPRQANQTTTKELLMDLVGEVAPADAQESIATGSNAAFTYNRGGADYCVSVDPNGGQWKVSVKPGAAPPTAPPTAIGTDAGASASGGLPEAIDVPSDLFADASPPAADDLFSSPPPGPPIEDPGVAAMLGQTPPPAVSTPPPSPAIPTSPAPVTAGASDADAKPGAEPIYDLLRKMEEWDASDVHVSSGSPPYMRIHGEMTKLKNQPVLTAEALQAQLDAFMPDRNAEEFRRRNDTDFAVEIANGTRFRINVFRDRIGPALVGRIIPSDILTVEQLGLPESVFSLCQLTKGLVLVTGPTGSGKSTTLATLVDYVNQTRNDHIITIEDPIEFVHPNKQCLVNQREVHMHTDSFKDALRAALREDPDVVLVGEMRDLETIAIAVETAETGHLVFGTLHTTTAPSTVDRIIDQFPADRQDQIRQMLAESLRGVIAQTLCRKKGGGRAAAYEILMANSAVSNLIRERKTFQLPSLMQTGGNQGMRTLNSSLLELVKSGKVSPKEAYKKAVSKKELQDVLTRQGFSIDQE